MEMEMFIFYMATIVIAALEEETKGGAGDDAKSMLHVCMSWIL